MKSLRELLDKLTRQPDRMKIVDATSDNSYLAPPLIIDDRYSIDARNMEFVLLKDSNVTGNTERIFAIDSSSRCIVSPYFFIGIGAVSVYNRVRRKGYDCPDVTSLLSETRREDGCYWLSIITEETTDLAKLGYIRNSNPAGHTYDPDYNRSLLLNELRLTLENHALQYVSMRGGDLGEILLIDGPVYYVPSIIKFYLSPLVNQEHKEKYNEAWKNIISSRLRLIEDLASKGIRIAGIVKRLEYARILSHIDPFDFRNTRNINDQTYLSMVVSHTFKNGLPAPFLLGPIRIKPREHGSPAMDFPDKYVFYVGIPRMKMMSRPNNYVFYRIELLRYEPDIIDHILMDSLGSGTLLPLNILVVDKRVKQLTRALRNYLIKLLDEEGIPVTYDLMRSIEGRYVG